MKAKKKNPLSYLGWVGVLGLYGLCIGATWMLPFLLFFFFFTYTNMVADELFWNQVRRAGCKAFFVNITFCGIGFFLMMIRASFICHFDMETSMQVQNGGYLLSEDFMMQFMLSQILLVFAWIITLCTFFFSLMYYRRQEKKFVEDTSC